jgi:hypothetical protein
MLTLRNSRSVSPETPLKLPAPENCPSKPHPTNEGGIGDLIIGDVVEVQSARIGVAQDHVGFAEAAEIADTRELPIQANGAQEGRAGDLVVAEVIDFDVVVIDYDKIELKNLDRILNPGLQAATMGTTETTSRLASYH